MGPFLCNELPVPTKDGVGSNERSNFGEGASSNSLTPHGKSSSLIVGQAESPATKLLFENAVLFAEIVDHRVLLATDPPGETGQEDLPGLEHHRHSRILAKRAPGRQLPREPISE